MNNSGTFSDHGDISNLLKSKISFKSFSSILLNLLLIFLIYFTKNYHFLA